MSRMNIREWFGTRRPSAMRADRFFPGQKAGRRIRRKQLNFEEEEDHRSVWKLAYADFMTAMMTFFLAMWLVNAAIKDNALGLESYFPLKLGEPAPFSRGPREVSRRISGSEKPAGLLTADAGPKLGVKPAGPLPEETEDEKTLRNPYPLLSALALQAETAIGHRDGLGVDGNSRGSFLSDYVLAPFLEWVGGEWWRDKGRNVGGASPPSSGVEAETAPNTLPSPGAAQERSQATARTALVSAERQKLLENEKRAAELEKDIASLSATLPEHFRPNVTVAAVTEGILICLTDGADFKMFKLSSAIPSSKLVFFLGKLGGMLGKYPGGIIVRGHTDARPFAGDPHGNWRLSANRATMTYYMLVRGMPGDAKFLALEGYGERDLKNKANPLAGENRRIEILIRLPDNA